MIQHSVYLHNVAGTRTTSFRGWSNDQQENILDLKPPELFCHLNPSRQAILTSLTHHLGQKSQ